MHPRVEQVSRVMINASIQDVWNTLTAEGKVLPFFFGSVLHTPGLEIGAPVRMVTPDGKYTGVVGEVLEFEPPYRYAMTFKFTAYDDPVCKILHELREVDGQVEYTLTASAVPEGTKTEKQMRQGGQFIVNTLKAVAEKTKLPFFSRFVLTMVKLTGWMTPKRCLSTEWPMEKRIPLESEV